MSKAIIKYLLALSLLAQTTFAGNSLGSGEKVPSLCLTKLVSQSNPRDDDAILAMYQLEPEFYKDIVTTLLGEGQLLSSIWYQNILVSLIDSYLDEPFIEKYFNEAENDFLKERSYRKNLNIGMTQITKVLNGNQKAKWHFVTDITNKVIELYTEDIEDSKNSKDNSLFFKLASALDLEFNPLEESKKPLRNLLLNIKGTPAYYETLRFVIAHTIDATLLAINNNLKKRNNGFWHYRTRPRSFQIAWIAGVGLTTLSSFPDFTGGSALSTVAQSLGILGLSTVLGIVSSFVPWLAIGGRSGEKSIYFDGQRTGRNNDIFDGILEPASRGDLELHFLSFIKGKYLGTDEKRQSYLDYIYNLQVAMANGALVRNKLILPAATANQKLLGAIDGKYRQVSLNELDSTILELTNSTKSLLSMEKINLTEDQFESYTEDLENIIYQISALSTYFINLNLTSAQEAGGAQNLEQIVKMLEKGKEIHSIDILGLIDNLRITKKNLESHISALTKVIELSSGLSIYANKFTMDTQTSSATEDTVTDATPILQKTNHNLKKSTIHKVNKLNDIVQNIHKNLISTLGINNYTGGTGYWKTIYSIDILLNALLEASLNPQGLNDESNNLIIRGTIKRLLQENKK